MGEGEPEDFRMKNLDCRFPITDYKLKITNYKPVPQDGVTNYKLKISIF